MPSAVPTDSPVAAGAALPAGVPGAVAVLSSKLAPPPLGHSPVPRPRLFELLTGAVRRSPVTLVCGLAGSGKTVLVATWMRQAKEWSTGWLTLDQADDDPATFAAYLLESLGEAGVDVSDFAPLVAGEGVPADFISRLAGRILHQRQPVVLILDNVDHLGDRWVIEGLDLLIRHAGRRLRLVVCGRAEPQLPMHQYRVAGLVSEIRSSQLAFVPDEARELLGRLGVPVTESVAAALCERTEGWAVGVRLAAAPLKGDTDPEELLKHLAEDDGSVAQYLFEEVLKTEPDTVRQFLLRISVTDELWPELVEQLGGQDTGRRLLAALSHANAFVEQSAHAPGGYRIHTLFREMLEAQLSYEHPEEVPGLHRTCAAWFADTGRLPAAFPHAKAAGDWRFATSLLMDALVVRRLLAHDPDAAFGDLGALPAGLPGPEAAVVRAACALSAWRTPAPADLAAARAAALDPSARLSLRISAAVTAVAGGAAVDGNPAQVLSDADLAAELLGELGDERARRELNAVLAAARASALLRTDAADDQLIAQVRAALAANGRNGFGRLRSRTLGQYALLEAIRGELDHATELMHEAEEVRVERGLPAEQLATAATAAAWVSMERYDLAEARRWMGTAQAREPSFDPGRATPLLAALQSRLLRLRHDFDSAEQVLRPQLTAAGLPRWMREQVVVEKLRVVEGRRTAGDSDLAELGASAWRGVFDPPPDAAPARGSSTVRPLHGADVPLAVEVGTGVARARRWIDRGDGREAVAALAHTLELAAPEGLRWPLLDAPTSVRQLLRTNPRLRAGSAWLDPSTGRAGARPGSGNGAPATTTGPEVTQSLSARELEVLQHLAGMLSTAEIAAAMFVSVNTVRTHIRSILRKLSVGRRNQAVRRAKELRIL